MLVEYGDEGVGHKIEIIKGNTISSIDAKTLS